MITNELISEYLISELNWPNKETIPIVRVNKFTNRTNDSIYVDHDILFKKYNSDKLYQYMTSIIYIIYLTDIRDFLRDKNLNYIVND